MATTLTDLPELSTVTDTTASTSITDDSSTATTAASTSASLTAGDSTTVTSTGTDASLTTDTSASNTATFLSSGTTTSSASGVVSLSGLPTIAGAGIPIMVIPYTAGAPFMQKSTLPEGTVFIAVGAVLAFLGACVLLWRGLVAWSINRSVKRAAVASIRGSEKNPSTWGGSSGYAPVKDGIYTDAGSSMSLDALTSAGKPVKPHFKDNEMKRSATPPAGLFFSPTAQTGGTNSAPHSRNNSSYLPAGYYASPSAQAAGGAGATTIGSSIAPYARHGHAAPSPPRSPSLGPTRGSHYRNSSRDGLRAPSRDGLGSARTSYLETPSRQNHSSGMYSQLSTSSLAGGAGLRQGSSENLAGSRAPSAYLDDLFENHGHGPRERF